MRSQTSNGGRPRLALGASVWAICVSWSFFMIACGEQQAEEGPIARPVKMITLGSGAGEGVLEYPGSVSPVQNAELAFEVPGQIIEFRFNEGQTVRQGTILARLDPRDYEAARDAEVARLNAAKADYDRYRELYASNAVSRQELEAKRRNSEVTEARVRTAQKALDDTRLRAPFSGVMARKLVQDFQNVQAKEPVLVLQDESGLEVVVNVPENDMTLARPGLSPEERTARTNPVVEISSIPGRRFPARIQEFSTAADPVTRTFKATFAFDTPADVAIRPGMTAKVVLNVPAEVTGRVSSFSIPASAVASDENGDPFVWKVDESTMTVSRAPVAIGPLSGSEVEVRRGLSGGDIIAITGVHNLRDGMLVSRLPD